MGYSHKAEILAGIILGIGMGGMLEGILFQQILQMHNLFSNRIFPDTLIKLETNLFWDGIFQALAWSISFWGIYLLWKFPHEEHRPRSIKILFGSLIVGWGIFSTIEGLINHHILQIHHVMERRLYPDQDYWDYAFLFVAIMGILVGRHLITLGARETLKR